MLLLERRLDKAYRKMIYENYATRFQDAQDAFDPVAAARWGKAYRWYLRGWLPPRKEDAIAELGCGSGRLLYFLRQMGYTNLHGVDISPEQVALARQVVPSVEEGDVLEWLDGRDGEFNLVIALDLVEHLTREEALRFLDLCLGALRPGGRLVLQTPNADSPFGLQHRYNDITHEWAYNVNQLERLLGRAGFRAIEAREQGPVPWGYSLASTVRWLAWRCIRTGMKLWNLAETGGPGSGIFTRVFLISGVK
jgi:SAM-dependent methyltransferase